VSLVATDSKWTDIRVSVDLVMSTQREANFLRMIDRKASILYDHAHALNAIRRYESYWLPLQVTETLFDIYTTNTKCSRNKSVT